MSTALAPIAPRPLRRARAGGAAGQPRRRAWIARTFWLALLAALLVCTMLLVAAWWTGAPLQDWTMTIDGERFDLPEPSVWQAMGLLTGLLCAAFVLLVVVPLALLFGLALPMVIVALVLAGLVAGAFGVGLLLLLPLWLPLVLLWWFWRARQRP